MATAEVIRALATVFDRFGEARTEDAVAALRTDDAPDSMVGKLFVLLQDLDTRNVPIELRDLGFFRFFVVNGLLQAQQMTPNYRAFAMRVIAAGMREFASYFAHLDQDTVIEDAATQQKRYFAFCVSQLIELGFDIDGMLMTMKGDAASQGDAYEVRRLRDTGPDAFADSYLFDANEQALWKTLFDTQGEIEAATALQKHFTEAYGLPFLAAPGEA